MALRKKRIPSSPADGHKPETPPAPVETATTESPLDYVLRVMRDPTQDDDRRDAMAKAALPYVHARLASGDAPMPDKEDGPISFTWKPPQK